MADMVQAWVDHLKITGSVEERGRDEDVKKKCKHAVQWETAPWMDLLYLLDNKRFLITS